MASLFRVLSTVAPRTVIHDFFKSAMPVSIFTKRHGSALFVTDDKALESFVFVTPYLDFDERFADFEKLQLNLSSRKSGIDICELKKTWEFYKCVSADRHTLEDITFDISHKLKILKTKEITSEEEQDLQKLLSELRLMREDIRIMKRIMWDLEEVVVIEALKLPNELDHRSPKTSPVVLNSVNDLCDSPVGDRKSHVEIGEALGLLEYKNPIQYYLHDEAALFELGVLRLAGTIFAEDNMMKIAGSDFVRSLVVEGCGLDHENPAESFILEDDNDLEKGSSNRMHLVGGASLLSFLAMHTKQLVNPSHFPLKFFATGRQYVPFPDDAVPTGLFTVCQSSVVHVFVAVKDAESNEYKIEFEQLIQSVSKLYDNVCNHYRTVIRPVTDLRSWETLRVSFEMWSSFAKRYIEVGHVSLYGHYLSKRLLISYQSSKGRCFPAIISGTVLSVPRL